MFSLCTFLIHSKLTLGAVLVVKVAHKEFTLCFLSLLQQCG